MSVPVPRPADYVPVAGCVGHGSLECPRCGLRCEHLVVPYFASPFAGGYCGDCCEDAAAHFDRVGWPEVDVQPA